MRPVAHQDDHPHKPGRPSRPTHAVPNGPPLERSGGEVAHVQRGRRGPTQKTHNQQPPQDPAAQPSPKTKFERRHLRRDLRSRHLPLRSSLSAVPQREEQCEPSLRGRSNASRPSEVEPTIHVASVPPLERSGGGGGRRAARSEGAHAKDPQPKATHSLGSRSASHPPPATESIRYPTTVVLVTLLGG